MKIHDWLIFAGRLVRDRIRYKKANGIRTKSVRKPDGLRSQPYPTLPTLPTLPNPTLKEVPEKSTGTPQAAFIKSFKEAYEGMTKQPFKAGRQHYVMASRLLKEYGEESTVLKVKCLGRLCESRSAWFTKGGWSDFTLETLSKHWNSILEDVKSDPKKEFSEEMKKVEAENERLNRALNR